ncbi:MAG: alpha/beta hydrolase [Myxococcales bacterium]|nr:alpha/beta hydrolase [Myxococcales bacterium]
MRAVRWLALLALVALGLFMLLQQLVDTLIFQPSPGAEYEPAALGIDAESLFLTTEDGVRIHAFYLPAPGASRALLFLHGNAGNASHRLPNAALLAALKTHVLLLDYRGFGRSEGSPSEQGLYADARAGLAHLEAVRGIPATRTFVFGRSLGGAVASAIAVDRPLAGVILESTFSSVADIATPVLGPLARPVVGGRFDSLARIAGTRAPLLFFHGDRDRTVPHALGQRLFEAAPEPKAFETLPGAGHNDTVQRGGRAYLARIRRFLDENAPPLRADAATRPEIPAAVKDAVAPPGR